MFGQNCTIMGNLLSDIEKKGDWYTFSISCPRRFPFNDKVKVEVIHGYMRGNRAKYASEHYGYNSLLILRGEFLTTTEWNSKLSVKVPRTFFFVYPDEWDIQCIEKVLPASKKILEKQEDEGYVGFVDEDNAVFL